MRVKSTASETIAKLQAVFIHDSIAVSLMTTKTITAFVDDPSEWNTTGTVIPVGKVKKAASLLLSNSISTITDKNLAVRVTNKTESPYSVKKITQIAELSVVTSEQSKFTKPVNTAILSMIPESDPKLTTYLDKLLGTKQPEQQKNTFWFPTSKNLGKTEDHTQIQTRIHKELHELKEKEKLNPKHDVDSEMKNLERFDWTDTLLKEAEKQAVEDILVEYHDIFARHRMNNRMNKEVKVKVTPRHDKAVYRQNLQMPPQLKKDLIVELARTPKYRIITVKPFSKYACPIFCADKTQR